MTAAKDKGFYTPDEFLELKFWKSPNSRLQLDENDARLLEEATRSALGSTHEKMKMDALLSLRFVDWPVASLLLHAADRQDYPILDRRVVWSLGLEKPPTLCSFGFWWFCVRTCRDISKRAEVSVRDLNKALWQYSKQNQRRVHTVSKPDRCSRSSGRSPPTRQPQVRWRAGNQMRATP